MEALTEREQQMLQYIVETIQKNGYSPSVRDVRSALGIKSTSTVHMILSKLEEKGYIQKQSGKSRTLRAPEASAADEGERANVRVPILGRITAGQPILATQEHEGYLDFPSGAHRYREGDLFALRVRGESMIEAGILDGDLVIIERRQDAEDGDIVAALIGDEATVKTFYREDGGYRLQPQNHTMKPILTKQVDILGKVIASFRYYS